MRIYSNVLTPDQLRLTVRQVPGIYIDEMEEVKRPKVRTRGWVLRTAGNTGRWKNSGVYGAEDTLAASRDQHGAWFALLFAIDPNARICEYDGADDFHRRTRDKYRTAPVT